MNSVPQSSQGVQVKSGWPKMQSRVDSRDVRWRKNNRNIPCKTVQSPDCQNYTDVHKRSKITNLNLLVLNKNTSFSFNWL